MTPTPGRLRLVGYCRVSTANQREEGTIEIQRRALDEYALAGGHELVAVYADEGVSGGLENRPALADLLDYLGAQERPVDGVLVYKLDRLARDLYIQEHLIRKMEEAGARLISIKEPDLDGADPMRKAFRQFMGIVAELEKAFITMRMSAGRLNKARKGKHAGGGRPMGYACKDGDLVPDPASVAAVRLIFKMKRQRKGLREIARTLNDMNIPTARGGRWTAPAVRYILRNPIYKGTLRYGGITNERADLSIL